MNKISKWTQINIIIIFFAILIAFVYPNFIVKTIIYGNKSAEAKSILELIEREQDNLMKNENHYLSVESGNFGTLIESFNIRKEDINYYNYSINLINNDRGYIAIAEPKIDFLRSREIEPKVFYIEKILNEVPKKSWIK